MRDADGDSWYRVRDVRNSDVRHRQELRELRRGLPRAGYGLRSLWNARLQQPGNDELHRGDAARGDRLRHLRHVFLRVQRSDAHDFVRLAR